MAIHGTNGNPDPYGPFRKGYRGLIKLADWEAEEIRVRRNQELCRAALWLTLIRPESDQILFDGFGDELPDGPAGRALLEELRANEKLAGRC
jgi:hypothetical protein